MSRPVRVRGAEELRVLHDAADRCAPPCRGDARFVDDDAPLEPLRKVCVSCPLFDLCDAYRVAARPKSGVWAGWRASQRRYRS